MSDPFSEITERIRGFISGEPEDFDGLVNDLFALQFEHVPPYRQFCESRETIPADTNTIPAISTSAFRDYEITSLSETDRPFVFYSSGTTGQTPSRHYHNLESSRLYEHSLETAFTKYLPPSPRTFSLTPPPAEAPHSSLVHMMNVVQSQPIFTGTVTPQGWQVNTEPTVRQLRTADAPATIMGTAFSFVQLCDAIEPMKLPAGSRVMETGGYKNQSRELPKAELHALITATLDVAAENIHCEYGMCELSSQAYAIGTGLFRFPHWARARIVSPENSAEVAIGETGLLEIIDLANVRSALAIRTADLAVRHADGFELLGRSADAEPRGCSLNAIGTESLPAHA